MSERKSINKYYPPDYDPSKIPKKRKNVQPKDQKVRLMAPFSMRCLKCNEYISSRRKFNARKEDTGEKYMGFKIWRFHITCPKCNNNITFKTNYKTAGFVPDQGAVRNYESTTQSSLEKTIKTEETPEEVLQRLEKEEQENSKFQVEKERRMKNPFWKDQKSEGDKMEELQNKLVSQMKQQELDEHLEQLQRRNEQISANGGSDKLSADLKRKLQSANELEEQLLEQQDDEIAQQAFKKLKQEPEPAEVVKPKAKPIVARPSMPKSIAVSIKKKAPVPAPATTATPEPVPAAAPTLSAALGDYSSDSD